MAISGSLTVIFRAHAPAGLAQSGSPDALERVLLQRFDEAREPWPGVALPAADFVRHVAERLPESAEVEKALDGLRLSDLYLACACANRIRGADEALERELLSRLPALLRRQFSRQPEAMLEEACQQVRVLLLVGNPPGRPHLLTYTGEGALMSWTRVIASRTVLKLIRSDAEPPADVDPFLPEIAADQDVERDAIKRDLQQKLREVVRESARELLTKEERYLLKLHYKDGVSTVKLAKYHGVAQANMWRQLNRIRERILAESKRLLRERHGIEGEGLAAVISGLESRFDMTLSSIFESDMNHTAR